MESRNGNHKAGNCIVTSCQHLGCKNGVRKRFLEDIQQCHKGYNHPEVDKMWALLGFVGDSFNDHILSTPGWLKYLVS